MSKKIKIVNLHSGDVVRGLFDPGSLSIQLTKVSECKVRNKDSCLILSLKDKKSDHRSCQDNINILQKMYTISNNTSLEQSRTPVCMFEFEEIRFNGSIASLSIEHATYNSKGTIISALCKIGFTRSSAV